jgi:hypothetical protein
MLVLPDADMALAADSAVNAGFGSAGQRCMAISVVVTVGDAGDKLVELVRDRIRAIHVGDGLDTKNDMGPLVTEQHLSRVRQYVDEGVASGATLMSDGRDITANGAREGFFLGPCLFDNVRPDMSIYRDEIFGPVLSVVRAGVVRGGAEADQRESVRERRRHFHHRRRRGAAIPERGAGRNGRDQCADSGADGVLLVRRMESVAVRRFTRARSGRREVLYARESRDGAVDGEEDRQIAGVSDVELREDGATSLSAMVGGGRLSAGWRLAAVRLTAAQRRLLSS